MVKLSVNIRLGDEQVGVKSPTGPSYTRSWTESYYFPDPDVDFDTLADRWYRLRGTILAAPAVQHRLELVTVGNPSSRTIRVDDVPADFDLAARFPLVPRFEVLADVPEHVVLMRVVGVGGAKRRVWLPGMPNAIAPFINTSTARDNPFARVILDGGILKAFQTFSDRLLGDGFGLLLRVLDKGGAVPNATVSDVTVTTQGLYRIDTDVDFNVGAGDHFVFRGSRGSRLARLRGVRRVVAKLSSGAIVCDRGPLASDPPVRYTGGAIVRKVAWQYVRAREGSPLFQVVGKRLGERYYPRRGRRPASV